MAGLIGAMLGAPAIVMAWHQPEVTPLCAPDSEHFAFTVTLTGEEATYGFEWSYGDQGPWTSVEGNLGANDLSVVRGEGDLYVRWAGDTGSIGHATPDATLCAEPSMPSVEPSMPSVEPSMPSVEPSMPSPEGSVVAETGTPPSQVTPPPTDLGPGSRTPSDNGWRLALLAMSAMLVAILLATGAREKTRR